MTMTLPVSLPTAAYPPQSEHTELINQLVGVYSTVIDKQSGFYVSCPMTSGRKYLDEVYANDPPNSRLSEEKRKAIFNKNCHQARSVVAMTRLHFPTAHVIDPTAFYMPGWESSDYLAFWREVLIKHVTVIRFVDDWQFSNGCAYEFAVGVITGKYLTDERERVITPVEGHNMIKAAADYYDVVGSDSTFLRHVINSLERFFQEEDAA